MTREEAIGICNRHALSVTSRGIFEYVRIDRVDWHNTPQYEKYPVKTDDADWAAMWFIHDKPFHDCDGCDHYPEKLLVKSNLLNVSHEFTGEEMRQMFDNYVFEGRLVLHQIIDKLFSE